MNKIIFYHIFCCIALLSNAQDNALPVKRVSIAQGEYWFGAAVNEGHVMPFKEGYACNLYGDTKGNQASPLLISTSGRYIWSEEPFAFTVSKGEIVISGTRDSVYVLKAGSTLQDGYKAAGKRFFPANGRMPDTLLFAKPQYNTWIELVYNQNQADILKYAHDIINNGFPPGVLMIDDNWAPYYGRFEFRKDRFGDPRAMIAELHSLGFKVMIWVCPFISPDTEVFRYLREEKLLLLDNKGDKSLTWDKTSDPAVISWWNGYSAVMDFTNPKAVSWYKAQLDTMTSGYGIDGFKLDAGDPGFYGENTISYKKASSNRHTELWGMFGLKYPLNEYRAMWKMGGQPLAERLRDKTHSWEDLQKLIPDITVAGLLGYQFTCPDMIGGGEFGSFIGRDKLDEDLVVRSAQCSALMPMMQFSAAPWRVLNSNHLNAVKKAVNVRMSMAPYIMRLARQAAITGEPIVRNMEYVFPKNHFENCHDQFMLGDSIMVAPIVYKGTSRKVQFPPGNWQGDEGTIIKGPATKEIDVPIDRLPWFHQLKNKR